MELRVADPDLQFQSVKNTKAKWFYMKPRLNYKASVLSAMPPTIDPMNWTPLTAEDKKAHEERQAIRGRLRREMWTKAYHPENYKLFNVVNSDKAFIRWGRLKTVWHMKDAVHWSGKLPMRAFVTCVVLPGVFLYIACNYGVPDKRNIFEYLKISDA